MSMRLLEIVWYVLCQTSKVLLCLSFRGVTSTLRVHAIDESDNRAKSQCCQYESVSLALCTTSVLLAIFCFILCCLPTRMSYMYGVRDGMGDSERVTLV